MEPSGKTRVRRRKVATAAADAIRRLVDRAEIHDLLSRYVRACDTRDWSLYRSVFTADALIDYTAARGIRGSLTEVSEWIARVLIPSSVPTIQHLVTNVEIAVEAPDQARVHAHFINPNVQRDVTGHESLLLNGGYYTATVRRTNQGWRITRLLDELTFSHRGAWEQLESPPPQG